MNTSEVLNRAADLIEEHGHATGDGWPGTDTFTGKLCLEGALMAAQGMAGYADVTRLKDSPAYQSVRGYLTNPEVNPDGLSPFLWQDRLKYGWHHIPPLSTAWVGGSRESAGEYAKGRVIEVLRATALIEAAKESADVSAPVKSEVA